MLLRIEVSKASHVFVRARIEIRVSIGVIGVATVAPRRGVLLIGTPFRHPSVQTFLPSFLPYAGCLHATQERL